MQLKVFSLEVTFHSLANSKRVLAVSFLHCGCSSVTGTSFLRKSRFNQAYRQVVIMDLSSATDRCFMSQLYISKLFSRLSRLKPGSLPEAVPSLSLCPSISERVITVVTTAALPWLTGTSINPLLRAAYLERLEHVKVILMVSPGLQNQVPGSEHSRALPIPSPDSSPQGRRSLRMPEYLLRFLKEITEFLGEGWSSGSVYNMVCVQNWASRTWCSADDPQSLSGYACLFHRFAVRNNSAFLLFSWHCMHLLLSRSAVSLWLKMVVSVAICLGKLPPAKHSQQRHRRLMKGPRF
jgi:hypothetical protein